MTREQPTVLVGGRLMLGEDTVPGCIGFSEGRIQVMGSEDRCIAALGPRARIMDIQGAVIIPGFIDSHLHLTSLGEQQQAVALAGCPCIGELQRRVTERARDLPEDAWITGRGWDQDRFSDGRYPTAADLDQAAPGRAGFLRRACGHAAVASTEALRQAGIGERPEDPVGGYFERDASGKITGVLHETAMRLVLDAIPKPDVTQRRTFLRAAVEACHRAGITSVQTHEGGASLDDIWHSFAQVIGDPAFALRAYLDLGPSYLDALQERDLTTGDGDEFLRIGALKLFADGSLGARSALMSTDYVDDPGNRGTYVIPYEEMCEHTARAISFDMQVAVHAIGDRALDDTLSLLQPYQTPENRHRVIHCQITRPEQFPKMVNCGVIACVQPRFLATDMRWAEARVGHERASTSYAWRSMMEAGVPMAGGSDAPVEPVEPLLGIHAAVNRMDDDGHPPGGWFPEERLSIGEAFALFGPGAARSEGMLGRKGVLEERAMADVVLLDGDPLAMPPEDLLNLQVLETWVGGRRVYGDVGRAR